MKNKVLHHRIIKLGNREVEVRLIEVITEKRCGLDIKKLTYIVPRAIFVDRPYSETFKQL